MISSAPKRATVNGSGNIGKPRVKMIAGGNKKLDAKKKTGADECAEKNATKAKADSKYIDTTYEDLSDRGSLTHLHSSYCSLGGSGSASNSNIDEFSTPLQQSPWKVKLKNSGVDLSKKITANAITLSPTLRKVGERDNRKKTSHDYLDPNQNSLLEEFATPRQSPWRKPKAKVSVAAGAPLNREEDSMTSFSESQSHTETNEVGLSKAQKKELKRLKKEKKEKKEKKSKKVLTVPDQKKDYNIGASILKSRPGSKGGKKKKKSVKFAPSKRVYEPCHVQASSRIAALARGRRARRELKIRKLQYRLDNQNALKEWQIKKIKKETSVKKKEFKQRARERFQKNLARKGAPDALIDDAQGIVSKIRKENAAVRARNQRLMQDIDNLRINNARLEASNGSGDEFYDRLKYHDDTCKAENTKLTKIAKSYKTAVEEHQNHLDMHISYGETENKIKSIYSNLLGNILTMMDGCTNQELVSDIYAIASALEEQHGRK